MEILSTGEKIKRARVYKGITLKELCKDKISISKMSCIENDKIVPEKWILEIVSEALDLDINYLVQNDEYQLHEYIKKAEKLEKRKIDIEELKYYIEYAEEKGFYKEAFNLTHILVLVYMEYRDFASISNIFYKYYEAYEKNVDLSKIFFEDISKYFFKIEQYEEALMYLERLYDYLTEQNIIYDDINYYGELKVFEGRCYYYLNNTEKLKEVIGVCKKIFLNITDVNLEGQIYALSILLNPKSLYEDRSKYNKMEQCLENNKIRLAKVKFNIALAFFQFGDKDSALKEIDSALECINRNNNEEYVEFLLKVIKNLIKNSEIDKAKMLCDEACDIAIGIDNIRLVEKTYYLKGILSQKLGDLIQGEMYMNLSTDALMKFGTKKEKYDRYIEMANMYHVIGELRDSLRYFTLAMNLEKVMNS